MAKRTAALRILFGADTKQFDKALQTSVRKMQRTAKDMQAVGKSLSQNLTAPLLGIAALSVKTAADFEFAMAKVQAVSGFTAAEMKTLEKQAQSLGASTSKTQDEVASLQLELAKLGKSSSEIEAMTEDVLSLSIAFDQELGETARVVGATLNQFGLEASESGRIADNMAILFGNSALDLQKFDAAMRTVGPTANALGLSVEEVGAAMGILVNSGVEASTVGTALTKSLTTLAKKGMTGAEALKSITEGNFSVAEAFEVFGDRAGKIIPILQGTSGQLANYVKLQKEGTGAAARARKVLEDTAKGGFDKLKSAASAAATRIGQKILPTVNKVVKVLTDALAAFAELDGGIIATVVSVGAFAAAIGPAIFVAGSFIFSLSQLKLALGSATAAQIKNNLAVLANPYVAVAAAVIALAGAFYLLSKRQNSTQKAQSKLNAIQSKADDLYAVEASELELLRFQYREAAGDLDKRKELLLKMQQIAPDTLGDLDAEKTSYEDLSVAVDGYLATLKKQIALDLGKEELTTALAKQIKLEREADRLALERQKLTLAAEKAEEEYNETVKEGGAFEKFRAKAALINARAQLADGQSLYRQQNEANRAIEDQKVLVEALQAEYLDLTETILKNNNAAAGGGGGGKEKAKPRGPNLELVSALDGSLDFYNKSVEDASEKTETWAKSLERVGKAAAGLRPALGEASTAVTDYNTGLENNLTLSQQWERFTSSFAEIGIDTWHQLKEQAASYGELVGNSIGRAFEESAKSGEKLGEAMSRIGRETIGIILAEVVGLAIKNAFQTAGATGPLALFLGPAFAAAAAGGAKALFNSTVPAFAMGGMVTGPTLSLLGDNSSGKEAVIPFERMGEFLGKFGGGTGGNSNVNVHGRVAGQDLILVQERGLRNQTRFR